MKEVRLIVILFVLTLQLNPGYCCKRKRTEQPEPGTARTIHEDPEELEIKCRDEAGRQINWFIAYKLAKIKNAPNNLVKRGEGHTFITPDSNDKWTLSVKGIGHGDSLVGRTIRSLYKDHEEEFSKDKLFLLYNDQPPNKTAAGYNGHTKGLVIANEKGGIWLQHSVPRFPVMNKTAYSYPSTGLNNGQMFFCMSLSAKNLETIGNTLLHTKPIVFASAFPDELRRTYPNLAKLAGKKRNTKIGESNLFFINEHGLNITIFAKGPKYDKEIYGDWIAPHLETDLKVQSWLNGINSMNSSCQPKKYQILNISEKKLENNVFSTRKDHSKWAVSDQKGKWTCIADLNRMESQRQRGGAAVCITNEKIWQSFDRAVLDVQPCGRPLVTKDAPGLEDD